jgi:hypothetical protein
LGNQLDKNDMGGACSTYGGKREVHKGFWWGDLREGDHLGHTDVDGRIILKWICKKWDGAWTGLSWLRIGHMASSCECGNEPPGSIKCGEFLD